MVLLSDLREIKKYLDIEPGDGSEDAKIGFLLEMASGWIEELLDRPLFLKERTEYYNGTNTPKLALRCRPVYADPTPRVWMGWNENGWFGSTTDPFPATSELIYGNPNRGFSLQIQEEGEPSRSGILWMTGGVWPKWSARSVGLLTPYITDAPGIIKITYTAGYSLDTMPATFRLACNLLVARLLYIFPLGVELNSENFEERGIGVALSEKQGLLSLVRPLVINQRNWSF